MGDLVESIEDIAEDVWDFVSTPPWVSIPGLVSGDSIDEIQHQYWHQTFPQLLPYVGVLLAATGTPGAAAAATAGAGVNPLHYLNIFQGQLPPALMPNWLTAPLGWFKNTFGFILSPQWNVRDWTQTEAAALTDKFFGKGAGEWAAAHPIVGDLLGDVLGPVLAPAVEHGRTLADKGKPLAELFMDLLAGPAEGKADSTPPLDVAASLAQVDYYSRDLHQGDVRTDLERFRLAEIEAPTLETLNRQVRLEKDTQDIILKPLLNTAQQQLAETRIRTETVDRKMVELQGARLLADQGACGWLGKMWLNMEINAHVATNTLAEIRKAPERWKEWLVVEVPRILYEYIALPIGNMLASLWEIIKRGASYLVNEIAAAVWQDLSPALKSITGRFQDIMHSGWNAAMAGMEGHSPITPEEAPGLALKMVGIATASGMAAHGIAQLLEWAHPLKHLGVNYLVGLLGELAGWGRWSAASIGVLAGVAVGQPMRYYVQERFRPLLPQTFDLEIMAVKPDIPMDVFKRTMAYQGYPDEWIDAFARTMYHEPRYFELSMMAEDGAAAKPPVDPSPLAVEEFRKYNVAVEDQWLFMKARRAGYAPYDSTLFTSSIKKKAARMQRSGYSLAVMNLTKEAYITPQQFEEFMEILEYRPEAIVMARREAALRALYDYISDCLRLYTDEYIKDVITEDELSVALTSLGIQEYKVDLLVAKARIRKTPKPRKPVVKGAEAVMAEVQKKYQVLYREQYRRGLIEEEGYVACLVAIGIEPALAVVTVEIERTKKQPKEA